MDQTAQLPKGMNKRLYKAAESGDVNKLDRLLNGERRLDVFNEVTVGGNTPLHLAAYHGHLEFVQKLIELIPKQDLEAENVQRSPEFFTKKNLVGNTALHEAATGGNSEVVAALLKQDYNDELARVRNVKGETALFKASEEGHTDIVVKLLPFMSDENDRRISDGQTPLHCAVFHKRTGVIEKLLKERPDLAGEADDFGRTPLHMLALAHFRHRHSFFPRRDFRAEQIGRMLLEIDTSLSYKVDKINKESALHVAVKEGNLSVMELILRYNPDCMELVDKDGRNALHLAVMNAVDLYDRMNSVNFKNMFLSIADRRRFINVGDEKGQTAFQIGLENFKKDTMLYSAIQRMLEKKGARRTSGKVENENRAESHQNSGESSWVPQMTSTNAVLIATVAFAAAFTMPGGLSNDHSGTALLIKTPLLKLFVICDAFAFCASIAAASALTYARAGGEHPRVLFYSTLLFWYALIALLGAFGAAMHIFLAPCVWLASLVWVLVCSVPVGIRLMVSNSKVLVFRPDRYKFALAVLLPLALPYSLWFYIGAPIYMILGVGLIYKVYHYSKKIWLDKLPRVKEVSNKFSVFFK